MAGKPKVGLCSRGEGGCNTEMHSLRRCFQSVGEQGICGGFLSPLRKVRVTKGERWGKGQGDGAVRDGKQRDAGRRDREEEEEEEEEEELISSDRALGYKLDDIRSTLL
eukprot:759018-Hanusia_phi.AAC.5